jgi:hypothetical protein
MGKATLASVLASPVRADFDTFDLLFVDGGLTQV